MRILGISAFYHDSAAALLVDGRVIAAAQEERFTRKKHDASFPGRSVEYCLKEGRVGLDQLDFIAFYDKPFLKFERLLQTYMAFAPKGFGSFKRALPLWVGEKLFQKRSLKKEMQKYLPNIDLEKKLLFSEHHLSHAASAFYPSPFEEAAVLTIDGVGEWATTSAGWGNGNRLHLSKEIRFPHSLGLLYSAFTQYTGFKVNSGEYKVMGLAPYGVPKFKDLILKRLLDVREDGSFRLDQKYFNYCTGLTMINEEFEALFGVPTRDAEEPLTQVHMDLAASIQAVTEEVVLKLTRALASSSNSKNLCLAGGVALNCVANGKILRDGKFKKIWIQPAAGDAGGALGAAWMAHYHYLGLPRKVKVSEVDAMQGSYLGPSFDSHEIEKALQALGARFHRLPEKELTDRCSSLLSEGKALGWFQGRMEFGPRALGNRSILADPRSKTMQSVLNLKVKFRESFRPFAPSVLREDVSDWFQMESDSPYMLLVADIAEKRKIQMSEKQRQLFGIEQLNVPRSEIPAVTHVDYSARIQTVHTETNPRYHSLISSFKEKTGCPVLVNTSFNVRGEPIVCTPEDAFRCFMGTGIEALAVGNFLLIKEEQDPQLKQNYQELFELD